MIDICNPTNLHPDTAIRALKAGKHVLVEKAIALQPDQADAMIEAAKNAGKLLMVAHVLPFFPEFAFAADAVRSGKYGKLLGGHFLRVIAKPDWSAEIGDTNATGGPAVDLHIHDTHFIGLIAGVPQSIFSTGQVDATGAVNYLNTSYLYGPGGPTITCSSGAIAAAGRPFIHGYEIYLEHATLEFMNGPLTVYTADGKSEKPKLLGGDDPISAFTVELQTAVDGIKNGTEPALLSGTLARDALVLCHREIESVKSGKILTIR
jgi:predicted dehydrogenase